MNEIEIVHDQRIFVNNTPWGYEIELLIAGKNPVNEKMVFVPKLEWVEHDDPGLSILPTMTINGNIAQALIDDLWKCGLRPSEGTGSAGSLKATENHLNDMQKMVWRLLPKAIREIETGELK